MGDPHSSTGRNEGSVTATSLPRCSSSVCHVLVLNWDLDGQTVSAAQDLDVRAQSQQGWKLRLEPQRSEDGEQLYSPGCRCLSLLRADKSKTILENIEYVLHCFQTIISRITGSAFSLVFTATRKYKPGHLHDSWMDLLLCLSCILNLLFIWSHVFGF